MARRIDWTRDQLLIALRLYMRTPFGHLDSKRREIIELAGKIGRTPGALAMKANNFASLDPKLKARGIKGLSRTSHADRGIWAEFADNPEQLAAEAEEAFAKFDHDSAADTETLLQPPTGDTDVERVVRARRVQSFFRAAVLASYENRCAISGIKVPELLVASHIIPWSESVTRRADPTNGVCLNALFDRAFDRGLITLDAQFHVVVSARLSEGIADAALSCSIAEAHGRQLMMPERFQPDALALEYHRENVFQG